MLNGGAVQSALIDTGAVKPYHPNLDVLFSREIDTRVTALVTPEGPRPRRNYFDYPCQSSLSPEEGLRLHVQFDHWPTRWLRLPLVYVRRSFRAAVVLVSLAGQRTASLTTKSSVVP